MFNLFGLFSGTGIEGDSKSAKEEEELLREEITEDDQTSQSWSLGRLWTSVSSIFSSPDPIAERHEREKQSTLSHLDQLLDHLVELVKQAPPLEQPLRSQCCICQVSIPSEDRTGFEEGAWDQLFCSHHSVQRCHACQRVFPIEGIRLRTLSDGRLMCQDCSSSLVSDPIVVEQIGHYLLDFFFLPPSLRRQMRIELINFHQLKQLMRNREDVHKVTAISVISEVVGKSSNSNSFSNSTNLNSFSNSTKSNSFSNSTKSNSFSNSTNSNSFSNSTNSNSFSNSTNSSNSSNFSKNTTTKNSISTNRRVMRIFLLSEMPLLHVAMALAHELLYVFFWTAQLDLPRAEEEGLSLLFVFGWLLQLERERNSAPPPSSAAPRVFRALHNACPPHVLRAAQLNLCYAHRFRKPFQEALASVVDHWRLPALFDYIRSHREFPRRQEPSFSSSSSSALTSSKPVELRLVSDDFTPVIQSLQLALGLWHVSPFLVLVRHTMRDWASHLINPDPNHLAVFLRPTNAPPTLSSVLFCFPRDSSLSDLKSAIRRRLQLGSREVNELFLTNGPRLSSQEDLLALWSGCTIEFSLV